MGFSFSLPVANATPSSFLFDAVSTKTRICESSSRCHPCTIPPIFTTNSIRAIPTVRWYPFPNTSPAIRLTLQHCRARETSQLPSIQDSKRKRKGFHRERCESPNGRGFKVSKREMPKNRFPNPTDSSRAPFHHSPNIRGCSPISSVAGR